MPFAIPVFTDAYVPIGIGIGALPVYFVILPFTNVFSPTGIGISALPVVCVILTGWQNAVCGTRSAVRSLP